jgi:hypothetical protein
VIKKLFPWVLRPHAFCEHCGELEPYDLTLEEVAGLSWCVDCAASEGREPPKEVRECEKVAKIKYFEMELQKWKEVEV